MGVFVEGAKNTNASLAGLKINYFFTKIMKPVFDEFYKNSYPSGLSLKQSVGIDTGKVMAVRSGIRNNSDLVWVGRAPNIAAKLSNLREDSYSTYITSDVFERMSDDSRLGGNPRRLMWEKRTWSKGTEFGVPHVYRSNWWWAP